MKSEHSAKWYFDRFAAFCRNVEAVSGATPHLAQVGATCEGLPLEDKIWRGGCYAAVYNFSAAEAVWMQWHPEQIIRDPVRFQLWIADNWAGLPLRKERKAVNSPKKLAACLHSLATWHRDISRRMFVQAETLAPGRAAYDVAWNHVNNIHCFGRYISIRYLEFLRRHCHLKARMYDARPAGGPYPRQGLALLYPKASKELLGGDSPAELEVCNATAERCLVELAATGVNVDHYSLQSLICEGKQMFQGRQFPVKALDSEIIYHRKVAAHFGDPYRERTQFLKSRAGFAAEARGELQGWEKRKPLEAVTRDFGYVWSDLHFCYHCTERAGWDKPVARTGRHGPQCDVKQEQQQGTLALG